MNRFFKRLEKYFAAAAYAEQGYSDIARQIMGEERPEIRAVSRAELRTKKKRAERRTILNQR